LFFRPQARFFYTLYLSCSLTLFCQLFSFSYIFLPTAPPHSTMTLLPLSRYSCSLNCNLRGDTPFSVRLTRLGLLWDGCSILLRNVRKYLSIYMAEMCHKTTFLKINRVQFILSSTYKISLSHEKESNFYVPFQILIDMMKGYEEV
jgi:hypothetical protein